MPARLRRERLLLVGCGDVGLRAVRALPGARTRAGAALPPARVEAAARGPRVLALTSSPARVAALRAAGVIPLRGDLDDPASLRRLAGLATRVLHLAPPANSASECWHDPRTRALLRALARRTPPAALVYASTSGVYGDCAGARVSETRTPAASTPRARRRSNAEALTRHFGRRGTARVSILRVPGIYASDREKGGPRARLQKGTPVLSAEDDVYTSHIHADDLARALLAALWRGRPQRVYNASDDTELKMGDYFDLVADRYGLPRPPRRPRRAAARELPPALLSFMSESRRLDNRRLKRELRLTLRYPTVSSGLL